MSEQFIRGRALRLVEVASWTTFPYRLIPRLVLRPAPTLGHPTDSAPRPTINLTRRWLKQETQGDANAQNRDARAVRHCTAPDQVPVLKLLSSHHVGRDIPQRPPT